MVRSLQAFGHDRRGSIAILFALIATIVIGITGLAIDFGRAMNVHRKMQAAVDAAAMAAATAKFKSDDERTQIAEAAFAANTDVSDTVAAVVPEVEISLGITKVVATGRVSSPFMSLLNHQTIELAVESKVSTSGKKLELALMFDVTGSMNDPTAGGSSSKMADAKSAAADLLDIVMPSGTTHTTRMSLVPFSQRVKLDADTISLVTGQPKTKQVQTGTTSEKRYEIDTADSSWQTWTNCVKRLRDSYFVKLGQDWSTADANAQTYCLTVTTRYNSSKSRTEYLTPTITSTTINVPVYATQYISPCAVERSTSNSARKTGEDAPLTGEWAATYTSTQTADVGCPPNGTAEVGSIIPLTTDRSRISAAIDALETGGYTAGHIGTQWSWYTISPEWRSVWAADADPVEYSDDTVIKAAILMTDGEYNSCNGSNGGCSNSATLAVETCQKMRAKGIQVWTIGFGMSTNVNDPARKTLVQCADNGRYFFPYNGEELRSVFSAIGQALSEAVTKPRIVN